MNFSMKFYLMLVCVRTSILSRRWRYVSAYKPSLRFNWQEIFLTEKEDFDFWRTRHTPCIIFTRRITRAINEYITFHRGEKIDLFELNFCFCCLSPPPCFVDVIDAWIKFALEKGVESLTLFTHCVFNCCKNCGRPLGFEIYVRGFDRRLCGFGYLFRTELFDGVAMKLKHLKLSSCEFGPNFTNQLCSLETISFHNVDYLATNLESMFPFLGKLKTLEITDCVLPTRLSLVMLPLLQKFLANKPCLLGEIELLNPDLIEFKCLNDDVGVKCNFSGAPNLTSLSYTVRIGEMDVIFTDLPRLNPNLRNRDLVFLDHLVNWTPSRSVGTFSQVTDLNLQLKPPVFSLVRIMAILEAFPILQRFVLMMGCAKDLKEEEPEFSYVPEYLREITLSEFRCTRKQLQFAIYLLENASALEKMDILPLFPFSLSLEKRLHMLTLELQKIDKREMRRFNT